MRPTIQLPAWYERAVSFIGVKEIPGDEHHPQIIEFGTAVDLDVTTDEIHWCSNFVNYCMMGICERTRSARARSWLEWGIPLSFPAFGCVAVLKRGGEDEPGPEVIEAPGHVGFFSGYDVRGDVLVLGGNQSNEVRIAAYPAERVLGFRWPG